MDEHQFTERRACRLVGMSRSSLTYRARPNGHARLRERLITLSGKHRKNGYRMLHAKLIHEGFRVNVKVAEPIYREERLNQYWFTSIGETREIIEDCRIDYNTERPHSSLKYQTPEEFAAARPFDKTQWAWALDEAA